MEFTETFPTPGEITSGQDQTWSEPAGDIDVVSDNGHRAESQTANDYAYARCETALGSADHYAQALVSYRDSTPTSNMLNMVAVRYDASANTCYAAGIWNNDSDVVIRIVKITAGSHAVLQESAASIDPLLVNQQYVLRVAVSTSGGNAYISVWVNGNLEVDEYEDASSPILTGVRCGMVQYTSDPGFVSTRTFAAGDGAGPPALVPGTGTFIDALASDFGWSLVGKDAGITNRHLANMLGGYMRDEDPGEAFAYSNYQVGLFYNNFKLALGYAGDPEDIDSSILIDHLFQRTFAQIMLFEDAPSFTAATNRAIITSVRDLARWGLLFMGAGNWDGSQLIAAAHFGTPGAVGTKFGEVQVEVPRTTGSPSSNYLDSPAGAMTSLSGTDTDENRPLEGVFGFYTYSNGISAVTSLRFWPDLPTTTMVLIGGDHHNNLIMIPSLEMVIAWRLATGPGSWPDQDGFNDLIALLVNGVTGAPSYAAEYPGTTWTTATTAEAGLDSGAVDDFETAILALDSGARVWAARRGRVFFSAGNYNDPQSPQSATKALGLALLLSTEAAELYQVATPETMIARNGWTDTADATSDAAVLAALQTDALEDAKSPMNPVGDGSDTLKVKLGDVTSADGRFLRYGVRKLIQGAGKTVNITVQLRSPDGTSLLDEWVHTNVGLTDTPFEQDISALTISGEHEIWIVPSSS